MRQIGDLVFEALFRYPRMAYAQGEIVWSGTWPPMLLFLVFATGVVVVAWSYFRDRARRSMGTTGLLAAVRVTGLAVLMICLLRPTLVYSTAVPQQNVVAILVDDSRSMGIPDMAERTRSAVARERFAETESTLLGELASRFLVRHFRFSSHASPLTDFDSLTFRGDRTRIGPALDYVREEFGGLPLSSIILVSDGGDQDPAALDDALLGLRAAGVPVHVVAAGQAELQPDARLERVEIPPSVLQGSTVMVNAVVAHSGLGGRSVPVHVEEDGRILASEDVTLTGPRGSVPVQIPVTLDESGFRDLRVRVPPQSGELVVENNVLEARTFVRDGRDKILYFEGQPRFEVGFIRNALRDDDQVQLVVLQRTGEDRYVRFDVDDGDELAGGFPRTREELFQYRGLILGSVEAAAFTSDQLRMIAEFVDRRGGGLLVLGGPASLAEGGYVGTALAPVLPLELTGPALEDPGVPEFWATLDISATSSGRSHPALHPRPLPDSPSANEIEPRAWELLPPLTTVNRLGPPRPGATVLLSGRDPDQPEQNHPVLAYQRYGGGLAAVLAVHDTWHWQMHHDIPLDDQSHELFWRQLLRWLTQDAPEPLQASTPRSRVATDEPVHMVVRVASETYEGVSDADVTARIVDPFGAERELELAWNPERDGEYGGSFLPEVPGPHEIQVEAMDGSRVLSAPAMYVQVGDSLEELQRPEMRESVLRRIASETGGGYYTLDQPDPLPAALQYTERGTVIQEERDLWDLPLVFLLLVGLLCAEWFVRRREGLA